MVIDCKVSRAVMFNFEGSGLFAIILFPVKNKGVKQQRYHRGQHATCGLVDMGSILRLEWGVGWGLKQTDLFSKVDELNEADINNTLYDLLPDTFR